MQMKLQNNERGKNNKVKDLQERNNTAVGVQNPFGHVVAGNLMRMFIFIY